MLRKLFTASTSIRLSTQYPRSRTLQPILTRALRTTIPKPQNRYIRFSDPPNGDGGRYSPRGPLDWRRWDPPVKFGVGILVLGGGYYVAHLEQVPETGRWRFMNTSTEAEAELGETVGRQLRHEFAGQILPPNHPLSLHVRKVASRILKYSNLGHIRGEASSMPFLVSRTGFDDEFWTPADDYGASARHTYGSEKEWDVIVVHDKRVINAMASPGVIIVFTGLLPVCQDEQGLAAVLSHEIGHVVARHFAERLSSKTVALALLAAMQILGIDLGFSSLLQTLALELPNSRTQELEADVIGLRLMARACYDPAAAPRMFERLGQIESRIGPKINLDILQTHPSSERRAKQLEQVLPEAYTILAANPECAAIRDQLEQFRDHSRSIRITGRGDMELV